MRSPGAAKPAHMALEIKREEADAVYMKLFRTPRRVVKMACFLIIWKFLIIYHSPGRAKNDDDFICVVLPAWRKVSDEIMTDPPNQICVFECNLKLNNNTSKQKLFGGSAFSYSPVYNNLILYKNISTYRLIIIVCIRMPVNAVFKETE